MSTKSVSRGNLDLSVELSTREVVSGEDFAIFVLVKNPFDVPIWIERVHVSLPRALEWLSETSADRGDLQQKIKEKDKEFEDRLGKSLEHIEEQLTHLKGDLGSSDADLNRELWQLKEGIFGIRSDLRDRSSSASVEVGEGAEVDFLRVGATSVSVEVGIEKGEASQDYRPAKVGTLEISDPSIHQSRARLVELESSLPDEAALQPGNTAVYTIVLNTRSSLLFRPSKYRLQFNINYKLNSPSQAEDSLFTTTIAYDLSIRASVYSVIVGSAIGGLTGSVARFLQLSSFSHILSSLGPSFATLSVAVILSVMAVIFMARKSDIQSFVAVEDFWGGVLVGFLVGYSGTSFFVDLTGVDTLALSGL